MGGVIAPTEVVIGLGDPGMTPFLRAGLGGLAASLRAILRRASPKTAWPSPVPLGPGSATVEPRRVTIRWPEDKASKVLEVLFDASFRLADGIIDLPGTYEPNEARPLEVRAAVQRAHKQTILQHGKYTTKAGAATTVTLRIDDVDRAIQVQRYKAFLHQDKWDDIAKRLPARALDLAGWAHPGAAQRHVAFGATKWSFTPMQALCGCFALVGCVAFNLRGGALVILEPSDLVRFAEVRPRLTPWTLAETSVSGVGDAVLAVQLALRMDAASREHPGVGQAHGVLMRPAPWDKKQKYRIATLSPGTVPDAVLDAYGALVRELPAKVRARQADEDEEDASDDAEEGIFVTTSVLRGFIAENLAAGRRWYRGFSTATTGGKKPRFIHYYRSRERRNLGALWPEERKGLIRMNEELDHAERALVRSVHLAIRQRFGKIADETKDNPVAREKRWDNERDRLRYAFAGSKTPDQIRAALADLWSRAGTNAELQAKWKDVLPLLRPDRWQLARDLALVALASYASELGLIRFGGHLMKGGYDGFHEGQWDEEAAGAA
jgi:CRISPR-associated protein Cas8a1/Csx13